MPVLVAHPSHFFSLFLNIHRPSLLTATLFRPLTPQHPVQMVAQSAQKGAQSDASPSSAHLMKTTKRGRPFLKVSNQHAQSLITSRSSLFHLPIPGHSRSFCYAHHLHGTRDSQTVLQEFSQFFHDVCLLLLESTYRLLTTFSISILDDSVTKQPLIWQISNSLSPIEGQIRGNLAGSSQQLRQQHFP